MGALPKSKAAEGPAGEGGGVMRARKNDGPRPERVEQLMSRSVATCRPDDRLSRAAQIMWERDCGVVPITILEKPADRIANALRLMASAQLRRLPVVDESGRLVGLLSFADVAREEARCHKVVSAGDLAKTFEAISTARPHELVIAS
jgi:CBS domain-containing protein